MKKNIISIGLSLGFVMAFAPNLALAGSKRPRSQHIKRRHQVKRHTQHVNRSHIKHRRRHVVRKRRHVHHRRPLVRHSVGYRHSYYRGHANHFGHGHIHGNRCGHYYDPINAWWVGIHSGGGLNVGFSTGW